MRVKKIHCTISQQALPSKYHPVLVMLVLPTTLRQSSSFENQYCQCEVWTATLTTKFKFILNIISAQAKTKLYIFYIIIMNKF